MSRKPEDARNLPLRKARELNESKSYFGSFAEIGGGQEVARTFLFAGKAGNTVAKIMSAYAMPVSDAVYLEKLPQPRRIPHTSRYRLLAMLHHEHGLLGQRFILDEENAKELRDRRDGKFPCLFSYANTLSSGDALGGDRSFHGWMGVRVQSKPKARFKGEAAEIGQFVDLLAHVVLLEHDRKAQYETVGMMGVNMIDAACRLLSSPQHALDYKRLVRHLFDGIALWKARVDVLEINPSAAHQRSYNTTHNNRELALLVVQESLSHEVLWSSHQFPVPAELCSGARFSEPYGKWRPVFNGWHGDHSDVEVNAWAYPEDELRVPVRFLSFKHNYLIPATLTEHGSRLAIAPDTEARVEAMCSDESLPVILLPSQELNQRGKSKKSVGFDALDAAYRRWIKSCEKSALLITRSSDLGWIVDSIRRSLLNGTSLTLVVDKTQWRQALEFKYKAPKDKLIKSARKAKSSAKKGDLVREAAQLSTGPIDCLQRIERAECLIHVLCDEEDVNADANKIAGLPPYIEYLKACGKILFGAQPR